MQMSFQLGTWCQEAQTERRHASVHASSSDTPHTVTHVPGVGSLEKAPTRPSMRRDVHTRSHTNGSPPPPPPLPASVSVGDFVRNTIKDHDIVVFSKSYCPYCKRAKHAFAELGADPWVVELDERGDGADIQDQLYQMVGRRTVPQVFIDGNHIGGSDDTVEALASGKLAEMVGAIGAQEL
eukprot:SM000234S07904  [mRNA]  locus=s234:136169:138182:- [translate_table: standard]